ncbi:MAG: ScpA family protein [Novosphingobium sp.]
MTDERLAVAPDDRSSDLDRDWERPIVAVAPDQAALHLDLDGWEGPLDLLLDLARRQKVDLRTISILELVDQYLAYIDRAGAKESRASTMRLELAADYLVMAAWLAYLKSLLLLPHDPLVEPSPEELALRLQLRLQRLAAMRESGARLMARDRLGRDVFTRGAPEGLRVDKRHLWTCEWFDLVAAYGQVKARSQPVVHMVRERPVMTLESALARVSALLGVSLDWLDLRAFLPAHSEAGFADPQLRRSALASSFVAALELAKQGKAEMRQAEPFAPLMLRGAR